MIERFHRELLGFLFRRVGNHDLAADLAQESFARVYAATGGRGLAEPRALLYTTARNLLTDHHRRSSVRGTGHGTPDAVQASPDDQLGPDSHQPEVILDSRQRLGAIERALASLPPRPREAFVLSKIEGLSRTEVAQAMGVGVRTVESHLEVAMRACMQALRSPDASTASAGDP